VCCLLWEEYGKRNLAPQYTRNIVLIQHALRKIVLIKNIKS